MLVGSLFSGAGLGDLGFTWAGFDHLFFCESDEFAQRVLTLRWPGVEIFKDIFNLHGSTTPKTDVLLAGFPCQAFSTAARGKNLIEKDMTNEFIRLCYESLPKWIIGENVSKKPTQRIAYVLESIGYRTEVFNIKSSDFGADHKRNRWWVVAHPDMRGEFQRSVNAKAQKLSKLRQGVWGWYRFAGLLRVVDGGSNRVDRCKCVGNGQDPFITYAIANTILEFSS